MCAVGKAHRVYAMKYPCEVFSFSEFKYYSLLERGQRSGLFPDESSGLYIRHLVLFLLVVPKLFLVVLLLVRLHQVKEPV